MRAATRISGLSTLYVAVTNGPAPQPRRPFCSFEKIDGRSASPCTNTTGMADAPSSPSLAPSSGSSRMVDGAEQPGELPHTPQSEIQGQARKPHGHPPRLQSDSS